MNFKVADTKEEINRIHMLYLSAFPEVERKPFESMVEVAEKGNIEMLSILDDNGDFLGLAITIIYDKYALLDYFAMDEGVRGKGYGTKALLGLKERYKDKVFFLEIESTMDECDNMEDRLRRKNFYLNCGMICMPYIVNFLGTLMEVLTAGGVVTYEEHKKIYANSFEGDICNRISFGRYIAEM